MLEFYRADAWDDAGKRNYDAAGCAWAWEQPELLHQLLSLRRAPNSEGLAKLFGSFRYIMINFGEPFFDRSISLASETAAREASATSHLLS